MGMKVMETVNSYGAAKHAATMEGISRKYKQVMTDISAAQQLNVMTENEIAMRDAATRTSVAIDVASLQDGASAEADAAAAGVSGSSVRDTMRGLTRGRLAAREALRLKVLGNATSAHNDRKNLELSRIMQKDISPISQPSIGSALLGLGAGMLDIYEDNQPK
jgi:hypothetical protein